MNRRHFIAAIFAGCAAPAIVRASSIMTINPVVNGRSVIVPFDLAPFWWDANDQSTMFQDLSMLIPAEVGKPVAVWRSKVGGLLMRSGSKRPVMRLSDGAYCLGFD